MLKNNFFIKVDGDRSLWRPSIFFRLSASYCDWFFNHFKGNVPDPVSLSDYVKNTDYIVYGSFIEIYNEKIYDLLVPPSKTGKRDDLRIRQDAKGPFVGNALEIQINTAQESFHIDASTSISDLSRDP